MKALRDSRRYRSTLFLTLVLDDEDGSQRHVPVALPPGKRHGTYSTGGWVGPRVGLDGCGKSHAHRNWIPAPSNPERVAVLTELSRTTQGKVGSCWKSKKSARQLQIYGFSGCVVKFLYETVITYHIISNHIIYIFIPWIRTGLQNPYGYGNSKICLRNLEVKSI
jgi:hypothetical protein